MNVFYRISFFLFVFKLTALVSIMSISSPLIASDWKPKGEHFVLIANGQSPSKTHLLQNIHPDTNVVAIDGGLNFCYEHAVTPHLITGDMDSASQKALSYFNHVTLIETPDQNKTDLEKALELIFAFPVSRVDVYGALGKREDQALYNLYLLGHYPEKVRFHTENNQIFALPSNYETICEPGTTISLIPLGGPVTNLTTKGLRWELQNSNLSSQFMSVSNEVLNPNIKISFDSGVLLFILNSPESIEKVTRSIAIEQ